MRSESLRQCPAVLGLALFTLLSAGAAPAQEQGEPSHHQHPAAHQASGHPTGDTAPESGEEPAAHAGHSQPQEHRHPAPPTEAGLPEPGPDEPRTEPVREELSRQGITVEFRATPAPERSMSPQAIFAGDWVDLEFRITDAASGRPIQGVFPGAWMDITQGWKGDKTIFTDCRERVGLYLQGLIGVRPLIDLNSYFVLVLNRDPSITVIDPITGITGITKLYAQVNLKSPGADWAKTADEKRLFVSMPRIGEVAVVNTDTFKVTDNVAAGTRPTRAVLQPDGQYLWLGNDADEEEASGVTVIAADSLEPAGFIATGKGHHEIAFSDDSRWALVSNRDGGSVTLIDVEKLAKVKDLATGPQPIALDFSGLSEAFYVADASTGAVAVIDTSSLEVTAEIEAEPGLGPLRFSQDGRWGVALNSNDDLAYVIDPATNRIAHTVSMGRQPYQVAFSRSFAYVRSLGSERVSMINLSELGKEGTVPVVTFGAGQRSPAEAKDVSIADAVVEAPGEAAVLVVSPADTTVYYYMEGMNAPMGNFRNYGHFPRAVAVVDRSLQERQPGVYSTTVRMPDAGTYEVAFLMDSPSLLHCFEMAARPNPLLARKGPPIAVEFLSERRPLQPGDTAELRFRLTDRDTEALRTDLEDVSVVYFVAPGGRRAWAQARHAGEGVYQAQLPLAETGAYYAYVVCPSQGVKPADLPFTTLVVGGTARRSF